jgi:thiol-disulfide isomerase/thioredoxin
MADRPTARMIVLKTTAVALAAVWLLAGCIESPVGTLAIGAQAPDIRTVTLEDVGHDLSRLTSYRHPDPRMYEYSLDKALQEGRPIVIGFATPAHCTVCDKQLQMLSAMMDKYEEAGVVFLHMDQYQNPGAYIAFRVTGEPWTFLIDEQGVVRFKRPGRLLFGELERVIETVVIERNKG